MRNGFFIFFLLLFLSLNLKGQSEKLTYEVYYNWGFIWIDAGTLTLTSKPDTLYNIPLFRLDGVGKSLERWNWLYKLNDHYTSWCYPDSYQPVMATKNTLEGGYRINNQYRFDYTRSLVYLRTKETRKPLTLDTLSLNVSLYDAQSATYKLRFLDVSCFQINDTITLSIIMDGVVHQQKIVYGGFDTLVTGNNKLNNAIKFTAIVSDNKLFSSGDAIKVWISDDAKRVPLYIEANITIGAIKIFYKDE